MHDLYGLEKIQTPRLILRPVALGDEHLTYPLIVHSSALLRQWMPWAQTIRFERTCAFVQRMRIISLMLMIFTMFWSAQGLSICCVVQSIRFDLHRHVGKTISSFINNGNLACY